jgi:dihydropteroate synthase
MQSSPSPTIWDKHHLDWGQRTYVMGIINATPDSFSGDGLLDETLSTDEILHRAVTQARQYVAGGAAIIDVGGESTRPGFAPLPIEQELSRVIPIIHALSIALPKETIISIDTYKAEVAKQALDAGASLVNDISALRADPHMAALVSEYRVPLVLMANMRNYQKREIVSDVIRYLSGSIDLALSAGVSWDYLIVDPGIGFGTTPAENLTLLRRLGELRVLGRPILLGASRKSTIGIVLGGLPAEERFEGSAAAVALGIAQGTDIVRVHDVPAMMRVVKMADAIVRGNWQPSDSSTHNQEKSS